MDDLFCNQDGSQDSFLPKTIKANNQTFNEPNSPQELLDIIERLSQARKYSPLTPSLRKGFHAWYRSMLNGFNNEPHRRATIKGDLVCQDYSRVVIGDYGAYLEFTPEQLLVALQVPSDQRWRLDKAYLAAKNLHIKYEWYEFLGAKVYFQCSTVSYADYKVGHYYINVLEFDPEN